MEYNTYAYNIIKKNIKFYLDTYTLQCSNFEEIILNITKCYNNNNMMQAIDYADIVFSNYKLTQQIIKEIFDLIDSNKFYIESIISATLNGC